MSERELLRGLLGEWRALSALEGDAIRESDWLKVAGCQRGKGDLRPRITCQMKQAAAGCDDPEIASLANALIEMESRNLQWLAEQRQKAVERKASMEKSSRDLRRVRSAYSSRREAIWNSFS